MLVIDPNKQLALENLTWFFLENLTWKLLGVEQGFSSSALQTFGAILSIFVECWSMFSSTCVFYSLEAPVASQARHDSKTSLQAVKWLLGENNYNITNWELLVYSMAHSKQLKTIS